MKLILAYLTMGILLCLGIFLVGSICWEIAQGMALSYCIILTIGCGIIGWIIGRIIDKIEEQI